MKVLYRFLMLLVLALPLVGCGGGGAPGSTGSVDTGIVIKSVSLSNASPDLDTHRGVCADGVTPEPALTDERATMTIDTAKLNPDITYDPFSASVEQCTIVYRKANEDPASPIIESLTTYPNCTLISGTNTCNVILFDIQRKITWWNAIISGQHFPAEFPTHYIAQYTCTYVSRYGKSGVFQVEYDIWLADWLRC